MADLCYILSSIETSSEKSFVIEHEKGYFNFLSLINAIEEIVAEMTSGRHHIRITFRTEVLIWYERREKRVYRALPLSKEEQDIFWAEISKRLQH
jgi:hypothetical protein